MIYLDHLIHLNKLAVEQMARYKYLMKILKNLEENRWHVQCKKILLTIVSKSKLLNKELIHIDRLMLHLDLERLIN